MTWEHNVKAWRDVDVRARRESIMWECDVKVWPKSVMQLSLHYCTNNARKPRYFFASTTLEWTHVLHNFFTQMFFQVTIWSSIGEFELVLVWFFIYCFQCMLLVFWQGLTQCEDFYGERRVSFVSGGGGGVIGYRQGCRGCVWCGSHTCAWCHQWRGVLEYTEL